MQKITNRITVVTFLVLIFGFSLFFFILPDQSFSEEENRSLRTFPSFSWEKLSTGEYSSAINDYFADQFPVRDLFVGVKGVCETVLGKQENNGILLGEGGQLADRLFDAPMENGTVIENTDGFDPAHVKNAVEGINRAAQNLSVPFHVLLTGRTVDVAADSFDYPNEFGKALQTCVKEKLDPGVSYIETVDLLRQKHNAGESVYYKTDHHWTTRGAYYAYVQTMREMGMEDEVLPEEAFEKVVVSEAFYGTAWSAGGMKFVPADTMEIWYRGNEDLFTVTADGQEIEGLYSYGYLEKKDQYSVFLDGTHDVVTVTKRDSDGTRPTLLLLKDSFANSLAPFLAQHFDLVLLNLSSTRTNFTDLSALAVEYGADRVLLVYTLENVVCASKLEKLR